MQMEKVEKMKADGREEIEIRKMNEVQSTLVIQFLDVFCKLSKCISIVYFTLDTCHPPAISTVFPHHRIL